jgi:CRP/FNR family cyclic AMP-dependent transcriptional regulator
MLPYYCSLEDVKMEKSSTGIMTQAIVDFLILNIPIFSKLKSNELMGIEQYMKILDVIPGEIVFEEGERGDYVCFVVEGSLEVLKKTGSGENIVISTLSKGRSIGEMAIIDDLPRSATVRAKYKSTLLTLSRENFDYIIAKYPDIGVKILKGLSSLLCMNLRKTSNRLAEYMLPLS